MNYFFVFAHPENEHSFQRSLLDHALAELRAAGHGARVSDLYAMEFEPVASAKDFKTRRFPDRLQYDREQKFAVQNKEIPSDVAAELDNLFWCDVLVMQFPLYWFSMPAIMKGWVDRVFLNSLAYGAGMRFETGGFKGKRAMVCTSTGGFDTMFSADGLLGDMNAALWHVQHGMLHYTGFDVLPPFVAWAPVRAGDERCLDYHNSYARKLLEAATTETLHFHNTADFGDDFKMKASVKPKTIGHWRNNG